jgi:hypothetical protein
MRTKLLSALAICSVSTVTFAGDLKPVFLAPTAKILPKGVRNFNYNGVSRSASEKYSDSGQATSIAQPLEKELTFQNIIDGKINADEKAAIMQVMATTGSSLNDTFGQTTGTVNVEAMAHVPIIAYGVTDKVTAAIAIPVVNYSYQMDLGVAQENAELYNKVEKALRDKGVSDKVDEFYEKINAPTLSKFDEYNYNQPMSESGTKLGDIKLVAKYQALNGVKHRLTVQGDVTLPTGEDQDINKAVDVASGDGQTDLGAGVFYDYVVNSNLSFGTNAFYTVQLGDTNEERIPIQSNSKASPDIDRETDRKLGNIWGATLGSRLENDKFSFDLAYSYQYKQRDEYSGTKYTAERYFWLAEETEQYMHSAMVTLGFSTVNMYRSGSFPVPMAVLLNHTRVLDGRNVVNNPLTSMTLSVYF